MPPKNHPRPHTTRDPLLPRSLQLLAGIALALVLAACGPGTGGTGTGPIAATSLPAGTSLYFGASQPGFSASPSNCIGSQCLVQSLTLEAQRIDLRAGCIRFIRTDAWSIDETQLAIVRGQIETTTAAGVTRTDGTLRLQFDGPWQSAPTLSVTLTDDQGRVLVGPTALSRLGTTAAPASGVCNA
jgi:hypothetical protein